MKGSPDIEFHYWELAVFPFIILLTIFVGWLLVINESRYSKFVFWTSYIVKFFFFLIGTYIISNSDFADAKEYYHSSLIINQTFYNNPREGLSLIFNEPSNLNEEERYKIQSTWLNRNTSSGFLSRAAGFFGLFGPPSFLSLSFVFSFLAFIGTWILVVSVGKLFPQAYNRIILCSLIPSLLYWTTVISKDALMIFFLGLFVHNLVSRKNQFKILRFLALMVFGYFLFEIKSYVLVIIIISWFLAFLFSEDFNLKGVALKFTSKAIVIIAFILVTSVAFQYLQKSSSNLGKINPETIEEATEYLFNDVKKGESIYRIRGINSSLAKLTPMGIIGAFEVTYFRPYLNELSSLIYYPAFIESTLTLILFLLTIFKLPKLNFKNFGKYQHKILLFMIIFAFLFGIVAGLFSFTFGSLVRYKIPGLLFLLIFMIVVLQNRNNKLISYQANL